MQPADEGRAEPPPLTTPTFRFGSLSWPSRLLIALAIGTLVTVTGWHVTAAFLYVSPPNTMTRQHGERIRGYINPEFEQNWKLFAPNPLQFNVHVQARAEILHPDGSREITDWVNLSDRDFAEIRHNPLPSHTTQNELRRAWDFYRNSQDDEGRPTGLRGELSQSYIHRIALLRLADTMDVATVARLQLRSASTRVPAPDWSEEESDTATTHHETDWRTVLPADLPRGELALPPPPGGAADASQRNGAGPS